MSTTERIGANVRTIARARGLSLRAIAKEMNFNNEQVLFTRLSGKSKMSVTELERLAAILDVPIDLLLRDPSRLLGSENLWLSVTADQTAQAA